MKNLESCIEKLWNSEIDDISCISEAMNFLNNGELRIVDKVNGNYEVNEYLKKAILLYFKYGKNTLIAGENSNYFDKIPLKTSEWTEDNFKNAGFRMVPGSIVRYSAYIGKNAVIMPSFINVGAYIDNETMIDSNALIGSCAQIGKSCHISDGVSIGGVIEPLVANPVIIEDNCFIGAKSSITEGVIIEKNTVLGAGTIITSSTKIIERSSGKILYGIIPAGSVVVPGTYESGNINLNCAVIIKYVDERIRQKTSINDILRSI